MLPEGVARHWKMKLCLGFQISLMSFPIQLMRLARPGVPMRVDHGRMMLDDAGKGYNPGYSFHGRMMALAQIEGMMAVINEESKLKS